MSRLPSPLPREDAPPSPPPPSLPTTTPRHPTPPHPTPPTQPPPHLPGCSVLFCRRRGSRRAFFFASWATSCHPPPKPTRQDARDCPVPPALDTAALWAAWPEGRPRRLCQLRRWEGNQRCEASHTNVVSTASLRTTEQRQSIHDNLQSTTVGGVGHREVQVQKSNVRGHPSPCRSAHACRCTLKCKPHGSRLDGHNCTHAVTEEVGGGGDVSTPL